MTVIWNYDNVCISGITTTRWEGQQLTVIGTGWTYYADPGRPNVSFPVGFEWEATVTPLGWVIAITRGSGRVGEFHGVTFNLPLEVAAAAKRLL